MNVQVESAQSPVVTEVDEQMSAGAGLVQSPIVTEFGEQVPTAAEQPLVVDKALVA